MFCLLQVTGHWSTTPLFAAAGAGQLQAAQVLLEAGADEFAKLHTMDTVLHHACRGGSPALVDVLVSANIELNAANTAGSRLCILQWRQGT
jgi:ankyrin repeat protein